MPAPGPSPPPHFIQGSSRPPDTLRWGAASSQTTRTGAGGGSLPPREDGHIIANRSKQDQVSRAKNL